MAHIEKRATKRLNSGIWEVETIAPDHSPIISKSIPVLVVSSLESPATKKKKVQAPLDLTCSKISESNDTNQQQNHLENGDDSFEQNEIEQPNSSLPSIGTATTSVSNVSAPASVSSNRSLSPIENATASESNVPASTSASVSSNVASSGPSNMPSNVPSNEEEDGSNDGGTNRINAPGSMSKSFASKVFYQCYTHIKQISATGFEAKCKFCSTQTAPKKFPKGNYSNLKKHISRVSVF